MTRNYAIAVQPKAWGRFDPHGCDWATSMDHAHRLCWGCEWATDMAHAYSLAAAMGEDAVIWKCPAKGNPMAWVTVKADEAGIEAIASLLFD